MGRPSKPYGNLSPSTKTQHVHHPSEYHRKIALLVAMGWSNKAIAEDMKLNAIRLSQIKNSPIVQLMIQRYRLMIEERSITEGVINRLHGEFHASMDKLATLRDTGEEESTQLGASKFLVEKAVDAMVPKKTINEEHKKVGVVILSADDVAGFKSLMEEDKDGDVEDATLVESVLSKEDNLT